jgi:hypothetical protein
MWWHNLENFFVELKDAPSAFTGEIIYSYFRNNPENLRIIAFRPRHIDRLRKMLKAWIWM